MDSDKVGRKIRRIDKGKKRDSKETRTKERYGQYMTPDLIADFMLSLMEDRERDIRILEPSAGRGVFIDGLIRKGFRNIQALEIDGTLIEERHRGIIKEGSFISYEAEGGFDVIIGNPPYIKWRNLEPELKEELLKNREWNEHLNRLNDYSSIFILKGAGLLKEGGEMILITPEYWLTTTHARNLRSYLSGLGHIEEIYFLPETPIFPEANLSLVIFRFIRDSGEIKDKAKEKGKNKDKEKSTRVSIYTSTEKLKENHLWQMREGRNNDRIKSYCIDFSKEGDWSFLPPDITETLGEFEDSCRNPDGETVRLKDVCHVGNGMVSGLDEAFHIETGKIPGLTDRELNGTIRILKAKNIRPYIHGDVSRYIFINHVEDEKELKREYPSFFSHLEPYRETLERRYDYGRKNHYWHWIFLRNYERFKGAGRMIMVPCKERVSNKDYFRFALTKEGIYLSQDVTAIYRRENTRESLEYILAYLNSSQVFTWMRHRGIVKGNIVEFSRRPLDELPFRKIDFTDSSEVELHDRITEEVRKLIESGDGSGEDSFVEAIDLIQSMMDRIL